MTMTKRNEILKRVGPFATGVLIGASVVTPVFAATLDVDALQPVFLLGSLIVLLIGLVLKAVAMSHETKPANARDSQPLNGRDLRWQALDPSVDVPLPAHGLR
jgi:hypothetical protein